MVAVNVIVLDWGYAVLLLLIVVRVTTICPYSGMNTVRIGGYAVLFLVVRITTICPYRGVDTMRIVSP